MLGEKTIFSIGMMVSKPFGIIPPVIISTASNLLIIFLKGLAPAAMDPMILNFWFIFLFIFFVSFELIAKPSKAALFPDG